MLKRLLRKILHLMPKRCRIFLIFIYRLGYFPCFSEPITFNEKIQNLKLTWGDDRYVFLSDKLLVRKYVSELIGEKYLIPLVKIPSNLNGDKLSSISKNNNGVVIKTNHSSGGVRIIRSGDCVDSCQAAIDDLNRDLMVDYGYSSDEPWYSKIDRKIFAEKLILTSENECPEDYKVHCFFNNGSPVVVLQVDYGRFKEHTRTLYDDSLRIINVSFGYKNDYRPLKKDFNPIIFDLAKKLASDFPYCRVDFYQVGSEIYFGEITFAHGSGFEKFTPRDFDYSFGRMWI